MPLPINLMRVFLAGSVIFAPLLYAASSSAQTKQIDINRLPSSVSISKEKVKAPVSDSRSVEYRGKNQIIRFYKDRSPEFIDTSSTSKPAKTQGPSVAPFIVGGAPTPIDERGYQVSLFSFGSHVCGGSLISSEWVLTAAHCVAADISGDGLLVMLGSQELDSPSATFILASEVIPHENYDGRNSLDYDVALVRLSEPAPEGIPFLKLADESIMSGYANEGDIATVSGWGYINNNFDETNDLLQVDLPIYNQEACAQVHFNISNGEVTDNMICAGFEDGGADSCFGDSGGPLTVTTDEGDFSIGIVSWGGGTCAEPGVPGVYTRTASFLDWINTTMQTPPPPSRIEGDIFDLIVADIPVDGKAHLGISVPSSVSWLMEFAGGPELTAKVFNGYYPLAERLICDVPVSQIPLCEFPLTNDGYYLLELETTSGDFDQALVINSFDFAYLEDGQIYTGFDLFSNQVIAIPFDITEAGMTLDVSLFADNGDGDLYIYPTFDTEWVCESADFNTQESCFLEDAPVGSYNLFVVGFDPTTDVTLEFHLEAAPEPLPEGKAICEHSVVTQFGKYFIASISVTNISEDFLTDWFVTWDYENPMDVKWIQNGILTSTSPYVAKPSEPGRAIAPGSSAQFYLLVKSSNKVAENPEIFGNYCISAE